MEEEKQRRSASVCWIAQDLLLRSNNWPLVLKSCSYNKKKLTSYKFQIFKVTTIISEHQYNLEPCLKTKHRKQISQLSYTPKRCERVEETTTMIVEVVLVFAQCSRGCTYVVQN